MLLGPKKENLESGNPEKIFFCKSNPCTNGVNFFITNLIDNIPFFLMMYTFTYREFGFLCRSFCCTYMSVITNKSCTCD